MKILLLFLFFSCQTRNSAFYQNQATLQKLYMQEYRDPTSIISTMPASEIGQTVGKTQNQSKIGGNSLKNTKIGQKISKNQQITTKITDFPPKMIGKQLKSQKNQQNKKNSQ